MRRSLVFTSLLLVAGCATAPEQPSPQPSPITASPHIRSSLLGLTVSELVQRLGTPVLQIREGPGVKLQFRSDRCVLDAYLYPPLGSQGGERVTHVDTRLRSGGDIDQRSCVAAIQGA